SPWAVCASNRATQTRACSCTSSKATMARINPSAATPCRSRRAWTKARSHACARGSTRERRTIRLVQAAALEERVQVLLFTPQVRAVQRVGVGLREIDLRREHPIVEVGRELLHQRGSPLIGPGFS